MKKILKPLNSIQIIMLGFMAMIFAGSLLLSLPISVASGESVPYIDALFTATTAACVTGLVTVPTFSTWSIFGQIVILVLIQIGGLGVITVVAGFMIALKKKINVSNRILISESFNLSSFSGIVKFVKKVITITFIVEAIGALAYMTVFIPEYGLKGIWISVFNSVSAFCNAGLDIIGENSLCNYVKNPLVNITTMLLIIFGGMGFVVWRDIIKLLKDKKRTGWRFLSLHSKIVLSTTAFLIFFGAFLFFIFEYNNPGTMKSFSVSEKIMASIFQSVTTRTAGYATLPQENFTDASAFVSILLMFIGGSPAGTAGGVKTVTVFVLVAAALSVVRNKRTIDVYNRQISVELVRKSVAVFFYSCAVVIISAILILYFSDGSFLDVLYETVSAGATVGFTRNLTSKLDVVSKAVLILTMYFGRLGPISLAFAFATSKAGENVVVNPTEDINIG